MKKPLGPLLAVLSICATASAFPPAPFYTLYGIVRDQVGNTITASGAVLSLQVGGVEIAETPITVLTGAKLDHNYELNVRLDANRTGTRTYSSKAVVTQGQFGIVVVLNGVQYAPIQAQGGLIAGKGGERVLLNLDLGVSSAKDGIPDTWKEWQLYQAGYYPDANGNWPLNLVPANGDFNHTGVTNYQQYIAGTFIGDSKFNFYLTIRHKTDTSLSFEYFGITGKTYTIDRSADLKTWTPLMFSGTGPLSAGNPGVGAFTASGSGIANFYAAPTTSPAKEFYRLTVR